MKAIREYLTLVSLSLRSMRDMLWFIMMVNVAMILGLILGIGYIIPDISKTTATFIVTGTATQAIVTVGLVMLPQFLSEQKAQGRLEFMLTLPISREAYLLSQVTVVLLLAIPAVIFALLFGDWHYGLSLHPDPAFLLVVPLAVVSCAGLGVAMAVFSPHQQLTNALTQLAIFYVLFFAPVILPKEQLPSLLRDASTIMPTTYAADAVRATLTDLPGTHLARSLTVLAGSAVVSLAACALAIRRRA
jgi:ABC-2 type transport system permease protein